MLSAMALNNDVSADTSGNLRGDSTEVALYVYADEKKHNKDDLHQTFPRIGELPFDASRKCMSTVHKTEDEAILITKGAVDVLFQRLKKDEEQYIHDWMEKADAMSAEGFRVLGYAIKKFH